MLQTYSPFDCYPSNFRQNWHCFCELTPALPRFDSIYERVDWTGVFIIDNHWWANWLL